MDSMRNLTLIYIYPSCQSIWIVSTLVRFIPILMRIYVQYRATSDCVAKKVAFISQYNIDWNCKVSVVVSTKIALRVDPAHKVARQSHMHDDNPYSWTDDICVGTSTHCFKSTCLNQMTSHECNDISIPWKKRYYVQHRVQIFDKADIKVTHRMMF